MGPLDSRRIWPSSASFRCTNCGLGRSARGSLSPRGWLREQRPRDRLQKVEGLLRQYGIELEVTLPSLAALLSIPPEAGYTPVEDPQQQKRAIIESYIHILKERSKKQPLLLVVEDLQWADPSSLDILHEGFARVGGATSRGLGRVALEDRRVRVLDQRELVKGKGAMDVAWDAYSKDSLAQWERYMQSSGLSAKEV